MMNRVDLGPESVPGRVDTLPFAAITLQRPFLWAAENTIPAKGPIKGS
jgi:hypothetical protein